MIPLWLLLGLACGAGGDEPTFVDELRVVTLVTEPAEARPGDQVRATAYLANPDQAELQVMVWTCLYQEDGSCMEAQLAQGIEQWVTIGSGSDGTMVTAREIPSEARDAMDAAGTASADVQLFALACPAGSCPIIAQVQAAMDAPGISIDTTLAQDLADPQRWMASLPMHDVSLVTRAFPVSLLDPSAANHNPVFDARFPEALQDEIRTAPGASVALAFAVADANGGSIYAYPLTTIGSFEARKTKVEDGQVRVYLDAPPTAGAGRVWVVFDDRDGGIAVFTQAVTVATSDSTAGG